MTRKALGLLFLVLCSAGVDAKPPVEWEFKEWSVALAQSKTAKKPIFVLFGYEDCRWCEYFYRRAMNDADLRAKYQSSVVLSYVDTVSVSKDTTFELPDGSTIPHSEFIRRFGAYPTPSWIFMSASGTVLLSNRNGKSTAREMFRDLEHALSKHSPG
jgi:thioredoxin-related protein